MRKAARLSRLQTLARLRGALSESARQDLAARQAELDKAQACENGALAARDDGLTDWRAKLADDRAAMAAVQYAGEWLLHLEQELVVARLDAEIAQRRQREASDYTGEAVARELATGAICRDARKELVKEREEHQSVVLTEAYLRTWGQ